ncbi:MAG: hypothetical protein K6A76_10720 [Oribacterium sp.]|nr:hypothetical protein [Oribacterium sp.]
MTRYLSPLAIWALSFGCAVGWGSFVMPGTTFLPMAGTLGTVIGVAAGAMLMLVIGYNYGFLIKRYPDSGGTLTYVVRTFGYDHGFISSWFLILVYITIIWANAMKEDQDKSRELGMNGHIPKPLDVDVMSEIISETLRRR